MNKIRYNKISNNSINMCMKLQAIVNNYRKIFTIINYFDRIAIWTEVTCDVIDVTSSEHARRFLVRNS